MLVFKPHNESVSIDRTDYDNRQGVQQKVPTGLSENDIFHRIALEDINIDFNLDRAELRNVLEYLQALDFIDIETIGGPFLYGHITITEAGLKKYWKLNA